MTAALLLAPLLVVLVPVWVTQWVFAGLSPYLSILFFPMAAISYDRLSEWILSAPTGK